MPIHQAYSADGGPAVNLSPLGPDSLFMSLQTWMLYVGSAIDGHDLDPGDLLMVSPYSGWRGDGLYVVMYEDRVAAIGHAVPFKKSGRWSIRSKTRVS